MKCVSYMHLRWTTEFNSSPTKSITRSITRMRKSRPQCYHTQPYSDRFRKLFPSAVFESDGLWIAIANDSTSTCTHVLTSRSQTHHSLSSLRWLHCVTAI